MTDDQRRSKGAIVPTRGPGQRNRPGRPAGGRPGASDHATDRDRPQGPRHRPWSAPSDHATDRDRPKRPHHRPWPAQATTPPTV